MPSPKQPVRKAVAKSSASAKSAAPLYQVIHLLSDSTGNLGQHMLSAFLTQFPAQAFDVRRHNFLSTPALVKTALERVRQAPGMVLHAFVSTEAKSEVTAQCATMNLPMLDLTGDFVHFLSAHSGIEPKRDVKLLHDISEEYHRRIKALEFTLEHDDGLGLETLCDADVVLVGVSRTSKTPTSIFLAQQGLKVANVSLAKSVAPPPALLTIKREKVVGLLIDPLRLAEIRTNRQQSWGMPDTSYNEMETVREEVEWSRKLFAGRGWATLDVTRRAVEETAGKIVDLLKLTRSAEGIK